MTSFPSFKGSIVQRLSNITDILRPTFQPKKSVPNKTHCQGFLFLSRKMGSYYFIKLIGNYQFRGYGFNQTKWHKNVKEQWDQTPLGLRYSTIFYGFLLALCGWPTLMYQIFEAYSLVKYCWDSSHWINEYLCENCYTVGMSKWSYRNDLINF